MLCNIFVNLIYNLVSKNTIIKCMLSFKRVKVKKCYFTSTGNYVKKKNVFNVR